MGAGLAKLTMDDDYQAKRKNVGKKAQTSADHFARGGEVRFVIIIFAEIP